MTGRYLTDKFTTPQVNEPGCGLVRDVGGGLIAVGGGGGGWGTAEALAVDGGSRVAEAEAGGRADR